MKRALLALLTIFVTVPGFADWSEDSSVYCSRTIPPGLGDAYWWENVFNAEGIASDDHEASMEMIARRLSVNIVLGSGMKFTPIRFFEENEATRNVNANWQATTTTRFYAARATWVKFSEYHSQRYVTGDTNAAGLNYADGDHRSRNRVVLKTALSDDLELQIVVRPKRIRVKASGADGNLTQLFIYDAYFGHMYKWTTEGPTTSLNAPNVIPLDETHERRLQAMHGCTPN